MLRAHPTHRPARSKRTLRVEALENRCMLSHSVLPAVHLVTVPIAPSLAAIFRAPAPAVVVTHKAANKPPVISLGVTSNDGVLVFAGNVSDESAPVQGLTVVFGGNLARCHLTATVLEDGTFSESMLIPRGGLIGVVTAQTHDSNGLASNVAQCWVLGNA